MVRVSEAELAGEYKLRLKFTDGSEGTVDLEPTIMRIKQLKPLLDKEVFAQVHVAHGTVCWPGDLDLAPETLYAAAIEMRKKKLAEMGGRETTVKEFLGLAKADEVAIERRLRRTRRSKRG